MPTKDPNHMMMHSYLRAAAAALSLAALAGCASVKAPEVAPRATPSVSVEDADRKLALAAQQRAGAEAAFAASEQLCYTNFLVNRCLDAAREKRRMALAQLRVVEIEAARYKRQATVDERDRALAKGEQEYKAMEAQLAAEPPPPPRVEKAPTAPKATRDVAAEQAAKAKKLQAQDQAGAAKRAASVADYEKRKRESEERQRKVAEKKAAKAAEAAEAAKKK
jgi:colicin import membrane protein